MITGALAAASKKDPLDKLKPKDVFKDVRKPNKSIFDIVTQAKEDLTGGKTLAQYSAEKPGTFVYEVNKARKELGIAKGSEKDAALKALLYANVTDKQISQAEYKKVIASFKDGSYKRKHQFLIDRNKESKARKSGKVEELSFTEEAYKDALSRGGTRILGKDGSEITFQEADKEYAKIGVKPPTVQPISQSKLDRENRGNYPQFDFQEKVGGRIDKTVENIKGAVAPAIRTNPVGAPLDTLTGGKSSEAIAGLGVDWAKDSVIDFGTVFDEDADPKERILAAGFVALDLIPGFADNILKAVGKGAKAIRAEIKALKGAGREFEAALAQLSVKDAAVVRKAVQELESAPDDALEQLARAPEVQRALENKTTNKPIPKASGSETPVGGNVGAEFRPVNTSEIPNSSVDNISDSAKAEPEIPTQVDAGTPNKVDGPKRTRSENTIVTREQFESDIALLTKPSKGNAGSGLGGFSGDEVERLKALGRVVVYYTEAGVREIGSIVQALAAKGVRTTEEEIEKVMLDLGMTPRKGTGLANQVNEREALAGVFKEIFPSAGRTAEEMFETGKQLAETVDVEALATRVANGEAELTADNASVLLQGKVKLMNEVDNLTAQVIDNPGDRGLFKQLQDAQDRLYDYLNNVQKGKGRWSDVGRALQMGSTYDGSLTDVIQSMERTGRTVDAKTFKQVRDLTEKIAKRDKEIDGLQKKVAELEKQGRARAGARTPRVTKQVAQTQNAEAKQRIKNLWDANKFFKEDSGVAGAFFAAPPRLTDDAVEAIKDLAKSYVALGIKNVEEVVQNIKNTLKAEGIDVTDQEINDALAASGPTKTRTQLAKDLADLRKQARNASSQAKKKTQEQYEKQISGLESQISELKAKRTAGDYSKQDAKKLADATDEVQKLREQRNEARKLLDVDAQIADIKRRLDEQDYYEPTKEYKQASEELENLRAERDFWSGKLRQAKREHEQSSWYKAARTGAELIRGIKLGSDLGILTRQGLFAWGNPKNIGNTIKALGKAGKSAFSLKNAQRYERARDQARLVDGRSAAAVRKKAGLSISDRLTDPEEYSVSRLLQKIPWVGEHIGGSLDRFQHTFINEVRAGTFDRAANMGFNEKELATRARFINNATGRGNFERTPEALQLIMTSPRYEKSRWAMIGEVARNPFEAFTDRGARQNVADLASTAAELFGLFKVAELAGYEVDFDPTSSDFLKMRKGEEVWDPTAGIAVRVRDVMRFLALYQDPNWQQNFATQAGKTVSRTLSPAVTGPAEMGSRELQRFYGNDDPVSYFRGYEDDFVKSLPFLDNTTEQLIEGFMPLIAVTFFDTLATEGDKAAYSAGFKEFIGQSMSQYPASESTLLDEIKANYKDKDWGELLLAYNLSKEAENATEENWTKIRAKIKKEKNLSQKRRDAMVKSLESRFLPKE